MSDSNLEIFENKTEFSLFDRAKLGFRKSVINPVNGYGGWDVIIAPRKVDGKEMGGVILGAPPTDATLSEYDLARLENRKIGAIVMLLLDFERNALKNDDWLEKNQINKKTDICQVPIPDHHPFTDFDTINDVLTFVSKQRKTGKDVYIHCRQGIGRSASLAAVVTALDKDESALTALESVKSKRPQVAPNPDQVFGVMKFLVQKRTELQKSEPNNEENLKNLIKDFNDFYPEFMKEKEKHLYKQDLNSFKYLSENLQILLEAAAIILKESERLYDDYPLANILEKCMIYVDLTQQIFQLEQDQQLARLDNLLTYLTEISGLTEIPALTRISGEKIGELSKKLKDLTILTTEVLTNKKDFPLEKGEGFSEVNVRYQMQNFHSQMLQNNQDLTDAEIHSSHYGNGHSEITAQIQRQEVEPVQTNTENLAALIKAFHHHFNFCADKQHRLFPKADLKQLRALAYNLETVVDTATFILENKNEWHKTEIKDFYSKLINAKHMWNSVKNRFKKNFSTNSICNSQLNKILVKFDKINMLITDKHPEIDDWRARQAAEELKIKIGVTVSNFQTYAQGKPAGNKDRMSTSNCATSQGTCATKLEKIIQSPPDKKQKLSDVENIQDENLRALSLLSSTTSTDSSLRDLINKAWKSLKKWLHIFSTRTQLQEYSQITSTAIISKYSFFPLAKEPAPIDENNANPANALRNE